MPLLLLRRLHELPALVHGDRGGDLGGGVLARAHCGQADGHVPLPRGRVVDQVQLLLVAHALEVPLAAGIAGRHGLTGRLHLRLRGGDLLGHDVANGADLGALDPQQAVHVERAPLADAHVADAHPLHR